MTFTITRKTKFYQDDQFQDKFFCIYELRTEYNIRSFKNWLSFFIKWSEILNDTRQYRSFKINYNSLFNEIKFLFG